MSVTQPNVRGATRNGELALVWGTIAVLAAALAAVELALRLGGRIDGIHQPLPSNPFTLLLDLARGHTRWPSAATPIAVGAGGGALLVISIVGARMLRRTSTAHRVDRAARHLGAGREVAALTERGATATAKRLGLSTPGLPIGRHIPSRRMLYASWEDVGIEIAGQRTGKTTSTAVNTILHAPGAVFATSNKPDLLSATRGLRAQQGHVWAFDPRLVGEQPSWWWNPLTYVRSDPDALQVAEIFSLANRDRDARTDAFFGPASVRLVANYLRAAALAGRPLTQVYLWLTDHTDSEPAQILREHGCELAAKAALADIHAPEEQRGGVFGGAQGICSFMLNDPVMRWVTPTGSADRRACFDPAAFVTSSDTLYSMSREGAGSAAALVTWLTVAIMDAAERLAAQSPQGRLTTPLVAVLDEAANVVRWPDLPNRYSHYGSKGILPLVLLQSWEQGMEVWGRHGIGKLWGSSNIRVYGGGSADAEFLRHLRAGRQRVPTAGFPQLQLRRGPWPRQRAIGQRQHAADRDPRRRRSRVPAERQDRRVRDRRPPDPRPADPVLGDALRPAGPGVDRPLRPRPTPTSGANSRAGCGCGEPVAAVNDDRSREARRRQLLDRAAASLEDLDAAEAKRDAEGDSEAPSDGDTGASGLYFASLWEFVSGWLLVTYRRPLEAPHATWCPEWWKHPEAVVRLDALWRGWELLRQDAATA